MSTKALMILVGYLVGSIPFGLLVSKIWNLDIRRHGSNNIGATNVYRILGTIAGGFVLILDYLKGFLAVSIGYWTGGDPEIVLLLGIAVVFGHMFSLFLGFRGGKGVATGLGVLAGIQTTSPYIFLFTLAFGLLVLALTRYVSLSSVLACAFAVVLFYFFHEPPVYQLAAAIIATAIILAHRSNILRLLSGKEPRLGEKA